MCYRPKAMCYRPKAMCYRPKAMCYRPKAMCYRPKAMCYRPKAMCYRPKAMCYRPKAMCYRPKGETLDIFEFIARVLTQISEPGAHGVRYFGAYSSRARAFRKKQHIALQSLGDDDNSTRQEERECAILSWKLKRLPTPWFDDVGKKTSSRKRKEPRWEVCYVQPRNTRSHVVWVSPR